MTNALTTTTPAQQFRTKAAGLLFDVASMTLYELVDEFQRLTDLMDENTVKNEQGYDQLNETGQLASRERGVVVGASKARFGILFEAYDRSNPQDSGF